MHKITLISTVHRGMGNCNADELCKILNELRPEVIFLEAFDHTYNQYEKKMFIEFKTFHSKLEVRAMQLYTSSSSFIYVPVLDSGLDDAFAKKYQTIDDNPSFRKYLDNFNSVACEYGFPFLNSDEGMRLHEEMRDLENNLLKDNGIVKLAYDEIDAYENSMLRNIYSYCSENQFNSAVFLCGNAHRKSIIEKMEQYNLQSEIKLNWIIYEG